MANTPQSSTPPHRTIRYRGTGRTLTAMGQAAMGTRGAQSLGLRLAVEEIRRGVTQRDLLSQIAAIYYWYLAHQSYVRDPLPVELVRDPMAVIEAVQRHGRFLGDCDCAATFITGALGSIGIQARPIRVSFVKPRWVSQRGPLGGTSLKLQHAPYSHVLVEARDQRGQKVAVDPVAGLRTARMLRRTKRFG